MQSRTYKIVRKVEETRGATSIYLTPGDDLPLQPFKAGQHLLFRIPEVGERAYALSAFSPEPKIYRITIEHPLARNDEEGRAPFYWLGAVHGEQIEAFGPTGQFHLPAEFERPLIFLTAGIGEAPLVAIAEELAVRAPRHQLRFFHSAINGSRFALKGKLRSLRADLPNAGWHVWYSRPQPADRKGRDFDWHGEIALHELRQLLPDGECEFFVCGPDDFVDKIAAELSASGIDLALLHTERLGNGRADQAEMAEEESALPPLEPQTVLFKRSGKSATWTPEKGSLLEFAESQGLDVPYSCRTGMCGKCAHRIERGRIAKIRETVAKVRPGNELLCSNVPISDLEIDL